MVKVLLCHHFKSQTVFCPKSEPQAIVLYGDLLFVCTYKKQIQIYNVKKTLDEPRYTFDTSGCVISLVYFSQKSTVITLEKFSKSRGSVVCVYHLDFINHRPVHCKVPIPGLINPACICGDIHTTNICVGTKERILLYHFTTTPKTSELNINKTNLPCYNAECLVEVNMSFPVKSVSLCEEFILCCSSNEMQLIRLKVAVSSLEKDVILQSQGLETDESLSLSLQNISSCNTIGMNYVSPYLDKGDKVTESLRGCTTNLDQSDESQNSSQCHLVKDDPNHVSLNCQPFDGESHKDTVGSKWLKTIIEAYDSQSESLQKDQVIIGPIQNHPRCAVFISNIGSTLAGTMDRSMLTYLYRVFDNTDITHIQLIPLYITGKNNEQMNSVPSGKQKHHPVILCYVSTPTEGYLYGVVNERTRLLQKYTYTTPMVQVCVTEHQLYVATLNGLEIYTIDSLAGAVNLHNNEKTMTKLFPACNEPCMIGLQPFLSLNSIDQSSNSVSVLSKGMSQGESLWSIYILQKPTIKDLFTDMMELASMHQKSSEGTYVYMLHQLYSYCWVNNYLNPENGEEQDLKSITDNVAFLLGKVYAGNDNPEWLLALPFLLHSRKSFKDILNSCLTNTLPGKGFWNYLDFMLFEEKERLDLDEEHAHFVLDLFTKWRPALLSTVIVTSSLAGYDPAYACSCLDKCSGVGLSHGSMNSLTTLTLQLQKGSTEDARKALKNISKEWFCKLCVRHSHMIYDEHKMKPLAELLQQDDPDLLVNVLTQCVQKKNLVIANVQELFPSCYMQVLEQLACEKGSSKLFSEIATSLVHAYLDRLLDESAKDKVNKNFIIPRRDGLFKNRPQWLDNIYPLEGTEALRKQCNASKNVKCPCTGCNADLLKLQFLLCSEQLTTDVATSVSATVAKSDSLQSVHLLCLRLIDLPGFIDLLIKQHTDLVGEVLRQSQDVELAEKLAISAFNLQRNIERQHDVRPKYKALLKDLLSVLCEMMSPAELFKLLPPDGNTRFFLPYVMRCLELKQSCVVMNDLQQTVSSVLSS